MPVMKFTDVTVRQAKADPAKRVEYFDKVRPGLGLSVTPKGARKFIYRYKLWLKHKRKKDSEWKWQWCNRKLTLKATTLAVAIAEHRKAADDVANGRDPLCHPTRRSERARLSVRLD